MTARLLRPLRAAMSLLALVLAAACGLPPESQGPDAPVDQVARAAYVHDGPPALTLFTMVNNRSGAGAHTSLMVNASQRVIFDPAGSVRNERLTERQDVIYGITPRIAALYADAHARETYHVIIQRIEVPAATAERALQLVRANGAVNQSQCALSTSAILARLPGFESIRTTWFPVKLSEQFGRLPGATTRKLFDDDADDKSGAIREIGEILAREK